jgi:hypothetical protein
VAASTPSFLPMVKVILVNIVPSLFVLPGLCLVLACSGKRKKLMQGQKKYCP